MTTPKKDGSIYLWLMGGQITIMLAFMALIGGFIIKQSDYIAQNSMEHSKIYRAMTMDSVWSKWVHRNQIIPAYELSLDHKSMIPGLKDHLSSIDSNLVVNNSNIRRVFLYLRSKDEKITLDE